jgi:hypothetical protein
MGRKGPAILLSAFAFLGLLTCHGEVPLTAPEGATLTIQANPTSIPAVGGRSTITVVGFKAPEDGGGTLADGTQIFFTSNLGVIEERVEMRSGIARATLQSDGRSGTATVTAQSGGGIDVLTTEVEIGTLPDQTIVVTANPATLGPSDVTSEIVATVSDDRGNPVPNVPVIFSTDAGALASQGSILRTNANGQVFDRLTLLPPDDSATVTATSGGTSSNATVSRGAFPDPIINSVFPFTSGPGRRTVTITGANFQPGATVSFGAGIAIEVVTWINSETLSVAINIHPEAPNGPTDVTVTNPDGGTATFAGGFVVDNP